MPKVPRKSFIPAAHVKPTPNQPLKFEKFGRVKLISKVQMFAMITAVFYTESRCDPSGARRTDPIPKPFGLKHWVKIH